MRLDWSEQRDGGVCVRLVLLAHGTALNILVHKLCETGPPKLRGDKLASLQVARVSGGLIVVAAGKDRATEGVIQGDVDMTFVGQDTVVILPVRETRPEGSGDVLQQGL